MSTQSIEALLARLYTCNETRRTFFSNPDEVLSLFDLNESERQSLLEIDVPGFLLATNSFSYKRWKANHWRLQLTKTFLTYDDLFDSALLTRTMSLFATRVASGRYAIDAPQWTPRGIVSDLLPVAPLNQLNQDHLLSEQQHLQPVNGVWKRLWSLHLRDHHLTRLFFLNPSSAATGDPISLHNSPGVTMTYVVLSGASSGAHIRAYSNGGDVIASEAARPGRTITFPADVKQQVEFEAADSVPCELLCIKTLAAI
ncbi:hypothetical protein JI739_03715 [Ramlibacter sp. AW1]|uniref:Uncharacterized protein n=1 Tax=Ramlibacter aurantiacus TaxID=2801330 RepID=A0A937D0H9_9BURK|nr:hypothetical protein [Ramlibacter aurantiacus]MBL0419449.1 hypothetical protein [Ramlibacter aurantiacus]